jgi:hypothetical protein
VIRSASPIARRQLESTEVEALREIKAVVRTAKPEPMFVRIENDPEGTSEDSPCHGARATDLVMRARATDHTTASGPPSKRPPIGLDIVRRIRTPLLGRANRLLLRAKRGGVGAARSKPVSSRSRRCSCPSC